MANEVKYRLWSTVEVDDEIRPEMIQVNSSNAELLFP